MNSYVALLRGINVGGNKKVEMSRLKKVFQTLGFENISSYINSGNIIFSSEKSNDENLRLFIETALEKEFGFNIDCLIERSDLFHELVAKIPENWQNNTEQKTDVLFLWDEYKNEKSLDLIKINPEVDTLLYISGAIVWNIQRENYAQSGMHKFIGTTLYKNMTARNINTVRKLAKMLEG